MKPPVYSNPEKYDLMSLGIVLQRNPGVTRWAKWSWKAVSVLPGAGEADWKLLREEAGVAEFHAATLPLELHGADAEAYLHGLSAITPCVYLVMRENTDNDPPLDMLLVTASPYEAQDYCDNGEDIVEKIPMTSGLIAWVRDFAQRYHKDEPFKKRRRDRKEIGAVEDGVGDARIVQMADVYRSPTQAKKERLQ